MLPGIRTGIEAAWLAVGIFWVITAIRLKPVARVQSAGARAAEVTPLIAAAVLLFQSWPAFGLLNQHVLSQAASVQWTGLSVTIAGCVMAIVARAFLGSNWSGRVTIKQGHELIRRGPYGFVRHPIYSGLLLSTVGTAIGFGEIRDLLAIPLVALGFWIKIQQEERFLAQQFGNQYVEYCREVKGTIVPHLL